MEMNIPEELKCPICFEIPRSEIFQCNNGHTICSGCSETLTECPQCREKYETKKIRVRALESLLDSMKLDCVYKSKGCPVKIKRQEFKSHSENCIYGGNLVNFCQNLGYTCGFHLNSRNIPQAVAHLEKDHDFLLRQNINNLEVCLEGFKDIADDKTSYWTPVILASDNSQKAILLFSMFHKGDKTVSISCLDLGGNNNLSESPRASVNFLIKPIDCFDNPDLQWRTHPLDINFFKTTLRRPYFRFPRDLLIAHFVNDGALQINCSFGNDFTPETKKGPPEIVYTFNAIFDPEMATSTRISSILPPGNFSSRFIIKLNKPTPPPQPKATVPVKPEIKATTPPAAPPSRQLPPQDPPSATETPLENVSCKNCHKKLEIAPYFKCLQCADYTLCGKCMEDGDHDRHIFAIIRNKGQEQQIRKKLKFPSGWSAMFPAELKYDRKKTLKRKTCSGCNYSLCVYVCLQCRPAGGYCISCFKNLPIEDHLYAVVDDTTKFRKLIQNMPRQY